MGENLAKDMIDWQHDRNMEQAIHARLPTALRDQLDRIADKLDRPVSWIVREAVKQYLAAQSE